MITAHSGCDETPENSLEFLRTALQSEADAVEVDVRKNGEGKLILSHDETQKDAVTLEEAFRMIQGVPKKKINCDLKQKGLEEEIYRLALEHEMERRLIFTGDVNPELFRKGSCVYSIVDIVFHVLFDEQQCIKLLVKMERCIQKIILLKCKRKILRVWGFNYVHLNMR